MESITSQQSVSITGSPVKHQGPWFEPELWLLPVQNLAFFFTYGFPQSSPVSLHLPEHVNRLFGYTKLCLGVHETMKNVHTWYPVSSHIMLSYLELCHINWTST